MQKLKHKLRAREEKLVVQELESKHLSSGARALMALPLMHATHS